MRPSIDHVVVGAGPAGSMLALRLAAAGREVALLEKQPGPHDKVCGEFLSAEALGYLRNISIDPQALGAHSIQRMRLHSGRKSVRAALPFYALSLSRRLLDEALLEKAKSAGCEIHRGTFVEKLHRTPDGFSIQLRVGPAIEAKNIFLATGKHDLADLPRICGTHSDLVGFKMHWRLTPQAIETVQHTMELFLFRAGDGGLALIESDIANLCFVIHQRRMRALGGWPELLSAIRNEAPAIDRILRNATPCWPKPLAISPIPYGYIARSSNGIWRVGDQAAVIPSFTGDGMSIALHSAELASDMYLAGKTPDEYLARLRTDLRSGMRLATFLSSMIVTSTGRRLAPAVVALVPGAFKWIAGQTRIPARAIQRKDRAPGHPGDHLPASAS
jgi:flavin-dependent dehydrogenase